MAPLGAHAPVPARTATVMIAPPNAVLGWLDVDGRRVDLAGQTLNIGRDPGSEVPISDPAVSYTHAQITRLGNDLYLRDVGSRNGTYVNAQLVSVPHLLREGDVIHVGTTDVTFHGTAATAGPAAPAPTPAYPPPPPPSRRSRPRRNRAAPPRRCRPRRSRRPPPRHPPPARRRHRPPPRRRPSHPTAPMAPVAPGAPLSPPAAPAMTPQPPAAPTPGEPLPGPAGPTAAAPAGPRLTVVVGPTVGIAFALVGDSVRVGREATNGIVLRDQTVSRHHAVAGAPRRPVDRHRPRIDERDRGRRAAHPAAAAHAAPARLAGRVRRRRVHLRGGLMGVRGTQERGRNHDGVMHAQPSGRPPVS